jgi:nucleotide-binding universal stress UspA family protein
MALHDRILLASDLSARSDRAMDRATMLAKREGASLVVLHVIEATHGNHSHPRTKPPPTLVAIARTRLLHDLGDSADKAQVLIEDGDPAEVIERVAREQGATLIVVGVARNERLGRYALGRTVERLVSGVQVPLLIVTDRPRGPYQHVCVAVDFSSVSRESLELTATLFPDQRITAFHAYQPLASYGASDVKRYRTQFRDMADGDFAKWIGANISVETRLRVNRRIEAGSPSRAIRDAAANGDFDLVVLGTRGRGRMFEFFIGSVAKEILAALPCDALFVRESK